MEKDNLIENLIKRIDSLEEKVRLLEDKVDMPKKNFKTIKKVSIKEFLNSKDIAGEVQLTLAVAYFIEFVENLSSLNADDLRKFFSLAKIPFPQNIHDKVNMNIKKGHMVEASEKKDSKKAWTLTMSGEKFVENNFENK